MNKQSRRILSAAGLITAALSGSAVAQQDQKLGKVSFPTSCDSKVQAEFDRGVAMLHSYWFIIARRTFEGILQQDPTCAMAYWGVAMDYLGNTLAVAPTRADAQAAWDALEKARAVGAKTQRERDWIEALSAYFRDHDKVAVDARLVAYNAVMEQMAQRYPDDYEVQASYALTLQASAQKSDLTYANQIKSAALLEKLFEQNPQHPGVTHYLIHAYDFAPLAEKGIASARRYAGMGRPCRTRGTCRRTSTPWSDFGKNPSPRTLRRLRSSPTTITRQILPSMHICSSHRMPKPMR